MSGRWDSLLDGEHTEAAWEELTRLAERLPADQLDALLNDLRSWTGNREMPERWWRERRRGEHQPWHALADHRVLWYPGIDIDLDDDDDEPSEDEPDLTYGMVTAAVSADLRWFVLGAQLEGNHRGGDIGLWDVNAGSWRPMLLSGHDEDFSAGTAYDVEFSPDGSLVAIGMDSSGPNVRLAVWRTADSELLWSACPDEEDDDHGDNHEAGGADDPWLFDPWDGSEMVVGFSGDGRWLVSTDQLAASVGKGRIVVVEALTGAVRFTTAANVEGMPVLDHTGDRLAYLDQNGYLVVQATTSGEILVRRHVGESAAGLTFAPDGDTLAIGGTGAIGLFQFATAQLDRVEIGGDWVAVDWPSHGLRVICGDGEGITMTAGINGDVLWSGRLPAGLWKFTLDGTALISTDIDEGETSVWFMRSADAVGQRLHAAPSGEEGGNDTDITRSAR